MAVVDDPSTFGRSRLSFAKTATSTSSSLMLDRFERGEITPEEWRKFRLLRGTYGQRQDADAQMLRVKIPQGILDAAQLEALADVADRYSRGFGHISTRQNMQFHFVQAARRGAGDAAARRRWPDDARGVRQFGAEHHRVPVRRRRPRRGLRRHAVRRGDDAIPAAPSAQLDAAAQVQDRVRRLRVRGSRGYVDQRSRMARRVAPDGSGRRGFRVNVAGGTAIMCRTGASLYEFLPASDILMVAEAVLRVFQRYGDYEHKQRNRLKFLVKSMGWEAWQAAFQKSSKSCARRAGRSCRSIRRTRRSKQPPDRTRGGAVDRRGRGARHRHCGARAWDRPGRRGARRGARPRADGMAAHQPPAAETGRVRQVTVSLELGDITGGQMRALGGAGTRLRGRHRPRDRRSEPGDALGQERTGPGLYRRLAAAGLGRPGAGTITDVTSCPGCRVLPVGGDAVARTRAAASGGPRSAAGAGRAASDVHIKISGCPNGCGQHHVAGDRVPGKHPEARRSAGAAGLHDARRRRRPGRRELRPADREDPRTPDSGGGEPDAAALRGGADDAGDGDRVLPRVDPAHARAAVADLEKMAAEDAMPADFIDPGEDHAFSPEVMDGECAS